MFSMVKYGLCRCHGGFGTDWSGCTEGDFSRATAHLSFTRPYDENTTSLEDQADSVVSSLGRLHITFLVLDRFIFYLHYSQFYVVKLLFVF